MATEPETPPATEETAPDQGDVAPADVALEDSDAPVSGGGGAAAPEAAAEGGGRAIEETAPDLPPVGGRAIEETEPDLPPVAVRTRRGVAHTEARDVDDAGRPQKKADEAATSGDGEEGAAREDGDGAREAEGEEKEKPRRGWKILAGILGVLIGVGVAVALILPGYLRDRVVEEARARGILLTYQTMDVGFSKIEIGGAKITLVNVPDVEVAAARIEVDVLESQPVAIRAHELAMEMFGTEVLDHLAAWKKAYPAGLAVPVTGEKGSLGFHLARGGDAVLQLNNARVSVEAEKGSVETTETLFQGRNAGGMQIGWESTEEGFLVDIKPLTAPLSALSARVRSTKERPQLKLTLARTALRPLQAALGLPLGAEGLTAEGEVEMPVPSLEKPAPVDGVIKLSVKGYVPPHPKELDGILFGTTTKVRADFRLAEDSSGERAFAGGGGV
ncbi:MAG: hypothetical protein R3F14_44875 [Polyangiaceae bacterium]